MHLDCVACFNKQAERLFEKFNIPESEFKSIISQFTFFLQKKNLEKITAPEASRFLNNLIKKYTGIDDLYAEEKRKCNNSMLEIENDIREKINKSKVPFYTAIQYALAGNIIDFGPPSEFEVSKALADAKLKKPVINHSF